MTAHRFSVSWSYREGERIVRRTLHNYNVDPCIEAARLINNNPYSSDVEVLNVDSGERVDWSASIGRVLYVAPEPAL